MHTIIHCARERTRGAAIVEFVNGLSLKKSKTQTRNDQLYGKYKIFTKLIIMHTGQCFGWHRAHQSLIIITLTTSQFFDVITKTTTKLIIMHTGQCFGRHRAPTMMNHRRPTQQEVPLVAYPIDVVAAVHLKYHLFTTICGNVFSKKK